ncbi:MAG: hypothetical protein IJ452_06745, partial [Butyricicoccus sp.]|nr:hypothetical protein [Butyricicoccus sp.]
MRKRIWSAILALSMLLTLAPAASAANSLTIDLTNGSITVSESNGIMTVVQGDSTSTCTGLFVTGGTIDEPTANTISVTGGNVALTIKDVYIQATDNTSPISVSDGSLALTLGGISRNVLDASTSKGNASKAGISLASGTSLTIDDGGYAYLIVNGGEWAAAIGGDMGRSGGNITINGGTIEANGGTYGAGIGGGYSGVTPAEDLVAGSGGTITINGGEIQAVSSAGAGIGGGRYGNGGTVTINGGTVRAASAYGAGIGGGQNGYGGYVKIGADVKSVTAEGYCTAIGGGKSGNEYGCTDLIIEDFSKVETAVTLEVSTPFEERFYNNILHNGMTETNTGYGWEYGELRFLARSGKSGYISDETCTWLWQWSADGETDWTEVEYSDYFSIDKKPDGNKYYRCIITNEFGNSIISPVGQILPLEITSQPQDAVAEQGETATFSVETN